MSRMEATPVSAELTNALKVDLLLKKFGVEVLRCILFEQLFEETLQQQRGKISTYVGSQKLTQTQFYCLFPKNVSIGRLPDIDKETLVFLSNEIFQLTGSKSDEEDYLRKQIIEELKTNIFEKHLKRRKNTITRRSKHGNSLYKSQINLLYPTNGGVKLLELDISLLSFLLLNTFSVQPTQNQYQNFPNADEMEVGDDVLRLRLHRNHLVHSKPIGIKDDEFESRWRDIKGIVSRRLGPETENEIDDLKTSTLNVQYTSDLEDASLENEPITDYQSEQREEPMVEVVYEQTQTGVYCRQITREDLEETKSTLTTFTQTTIENEGRNIRDDVRVELRKMNQSLRSEIFLQVKSDKSHKGSSALMSGEFQKWENEDDTFFEETESTKNAATILERRNVLCIIGGPGSGKAMTARHIALALQDDGFELYSLTQASQIEDCFLSDENQVFVFSNPLGVDSVQLNLLHEWETYNTKLHANMKTQKGKKKLIVTMTTNVANDPKFQHSKLFFRKNKYFHRLTCPSLQEKRRILSKHLEAQGVSGTNIDISDDVLESCRFGFFPLLCKMFAKQNEIIDNPNEFFSNPKQALQNIFHQMKNRELHQFCALAIVAIEDENKTKAENENAKSELLDMFDVKKQRYKVEKGKDLLVGSFLNLTDDGQYEVLNTVFKDLVCQILAVEFKCESFTFLPGDFIHKKVKLSDGPAPDEESVFLINYADKYALQLYSRRVVSDLINGFFEAVFGNRNIHHTKFLHEIKVLLINDRGLLDELKVNSYDTLSWAIKTYNVAFVRILLELDIDVNVTDKRNGITPLWLSVQLDFFQKIGIFPQCGTPSSSRYLAQLLVRKGANLNSCRQHDATTPLWWSVFHGNFELTKYFIDHNASINSSNVFGQSPLWWSCFVNEHPDIIDLLLEKHADVNTQSETDETSCLYWAIYHDDDMLFEKLSRYKPKLHKDSNSLWLAVKNNDCGKTLYLMKNGAMVTKRGPDGTTPLSWSTTQCNVKVTEALLRKGADANAPISEDDKRTPFWIACCLGNYELIRLLIEHEADVNATCSNNRSVVWLAALRNDAALVRWLVERNADINMRSSDGTSAFWWAVFNDNTDLVHFLLNHDADVNVKNNDGITPLWLSTYSNISLAPCIFARYPTIGTECKLDIKNPLYAAIAHSDRQTAMKLFRVIENGMSPLHYMAKKNQDRIGFILIEHGVDIDIVVEDGTTPFYWLVRHNRNRLANILLDKGVDVDTVYEQDGTSPLWYAIYHRHVDIAEKILKQKPRVNTIDKESNTSPLWWAAFHNCTILVSMLLELGADVNISATDNTSPLWWSCVRNNITVAKEILELCQDVNIPNDKDKKSPMHHAKLHGNEELVEFLRSHGARDIKYRNDTSDCKSIYGEQLSRNTNIVDIHTEERITEDEFRNTQPGAVGTDDGIMYAAYRNTQDVTRRRQTRRTDYEAADRTPYEKFLNSSTEEDIRHFVDRSVDNDETNTDSEVNETLL